MQDKQVAEVGAPVTADSVPAGHEVQLDWPTTAANEPAGQLRHTADPVTEKEPSAQLLQLGASIIAE